MTRENPTIWRMWFSIAMSVFSGGESKNFNIQTLRFTVHGAKSKEFQIVEPD